MSLDCETEIHFNANFRAGYNQTRAGKFRLLLSATSCLGLCSSGIMLSWHCFMSILSQQLRDKHDHWQFQLAGSSSMHCALMTGAHHPSHEHR